MDKVDVDKACKAFIETDAYFLRPHSSDIFAQNLWTAFGNRFQTFDCPLQTYQNLISESFISSRLTRSNAQPSL